MINEYELKIAPMIFLHQVDIRPNQFVYGISRSSWSNIQSIQLVCIRSYLIRRYTQPFFFGPPATWFKNNVNVVRLVAGFPFILSQVVHHLLLRLFIAHCNVLLLIFSILHTSRFMRIRCVCILLSLFQIRCDFPLSFHLTRITSSHTFLGELMY